jgi:serine/threonine-protein kinase
MVGRSDAPKTIDVFDEPICPPCGEFVTSYSADIGQAVAAGKIAVRYHLLNFLDSASASGTYSTRAIAASYCVAVKDPNAYSAFYAGIFAPAFQPKEKASTDRTDAELANLAQAVGAGPGSTACIRSGEQVAIAGTKATNAGALLQQLSAAVSTPQVYEGTRRVDISAGWVDALG